MGASRRGDQGDSSPQREELLAAAAVEEARLAKLELERVGSAERLRGIRAQLSSLETPTDGAPRTAQDPKSPLATSTEKVRLFRSLFRGRPDVYPTRFVSKTTGRPGYAPACRNKFVPGVCGLPKIKCGECPNQAFEPVDDSAIVAHLKGRHVMGVYPLLEDETCWFLAADFDKSTWKEDVKAFLETSRRAGLKPAVERSRSGNGAHIWFFFSTPIPASTARTLGCYLITQTMARRHELSFESYDRLFPSQDTMPRGGFGNLIALPLQRGPREQGKSVFLDDDLNPIPDERQWEYLAAIGRIDPAAVERIASEAASNGADLDLSAPEADDDPARAPWVRAPSRKRRIVISEPIPRLVRAVLAQKLFVDKTSLPAALLDQIKRLAAFQNPEFYKRQSMRLSTTMTPRVILCAEDLPQHVGLPRGCQLPLEKMLADHGSALEVDDQRIVGTPIGHQFRGELTHLQQQAAGALLAHDIGVFVAPPGVGKTVVGTYLVSRRGCNTLIIVNRRPLLDQWVAQLALFLGVEPVDIGQIAAGKHTRNGQLDVAMIQSLTRKGAVSDVVSEYGHVIVDECHHMAAVSFEQVLSEVKARYVLGLTSTPQRRDGHHPITEMQLGPPRFTVAARSENAKPPFAQRLVVRATGFGGPAVSSRAIQDLYALLAADAARNRLIVGDVLAALAEGRSPIVLTERRDHLQYLADRIEPFVANMIVLRGGMSAKERRKELERLAAIPDAEPRLVLATGRYVGEGFDDARLDTLFLALPVSWKGTLIQYAGRLHRLRALKTEVRIVDYVDGEVPMLRRMFERRLRGYRAIGYARDEGALELFDVARDE